MKWQVQRIFKILSGVLVLILSFLFLFGFRLGNLLVPYLTYAKVEIPLDVLQEVVCVDESSRFFSFSYLVPVDKDKLSFWETIVWKVNNIEIKEFPQFDIISKYLLYFVLYTFALSVFFAIAYVMYLSIYNIFKHFFYTVEVVAADVEVVRKYIVDNTTETIMIINNMPTPVTTGTIDYYIDYQLDGYDMSLKIKEQDYDVIKLNKKVRNMARVNIINKKWLGRVMHTKVTLDLN